MADPLIEQITRLQMERDKLAAMDQSRQLSDPISTLRQPRPKERDPAEELLRARINAESTDYIPPKILIPGVDYPVPDAPTQWYPGLTPPAHEPMSKGGPVPPSQLSPAALDGLTRMMTQQLIDQRNSQRRAVQAVPTGAGGAALPPPTPLLRAPPIRR